jgi:hypothetical protein
MDYRKVKRTIREIKQASKQVIRNSHYLLLALSSRYLWILERLESHYVGYLEYHMLLLPTHGRIPKVIKSTNQTALSLEMRHAFLSADLDERRTAIKR